MSVPYSPPTPGPTFTLVQTRDAGSPTAELIAEEDSSAFLRCVVQDVMERTATRGYTREVLRWLDLVEFATQIDRPREIHETRVLNGTAHDAYVLIIDRPAVRR